MASISTTQPIDLSSLGYGLAFTGFLIISPPSDRPKVGMCSGGKRLCLIEVSNGQPSSVWIYQKGMPLETPVGLLADGTGYHIGLLPGPLSYLKENLDTLSLECRPCQRSVDISGNLEASALIGASSPLRTGVIPDPPPPTDPGDTTTPLGDVTPPLISIIGGGPLGDTAVVTDTIPTTGQIISGEVI